MRMHFRGTLLVVAICVLSGLGAGCADEDGDSHCSGPGDCPDGRECRQGLCRPVGDADTDADTDADSDADTDADVDTDADTDTDADSDGDTDGDTDTDSDSDSDTDTTVQADVDISANRIYNTVAALAADELLGRLPANPGNETALDMVQTLFTELGLTPAGDAAGTTFRQGFGFEIRSSELELGGDVLCEFIEFQFSALGNATAEIVFAGYGMTVPPFDAASYPGCTLDPATGYDDYAGLDVTGKIVLLLRHGPGDDEALYNNCPSDPVCVGGPCLWNFSTKAANARARGAAAMLLVNDYRHDALSEAAGVALDEDASDDDLPALFVDRGAVEAKIPDLQTWADAIDANLTGNGHATGVSATLNLGVSSGETDNILGVVPGTDPVLQDEVVVIGGHIDHVGIDFCEIYNGADDNASGTAVMMELARALATYEIAPARTVLFAAWNAEEMGLIGSYYYVQDPSYPIGDMVAMFSVDMVGAGDGSGVSIFGGLLQEHRWLGDLMASSATSKAIDGLVSPVEPFDYDASDHAWFEHAGVPAVLISTRGEHLYYHTPEDTIANILEQDLGTAAWLMWAVLEPLAMGTEDQYLSKRAALKLAPLRARDFVPPARLVRR